MCNFRFDGNPKLPIKAFGSIRIKGWDIPVDWAIDSNNQCWKDGGHGGNLKPVKKGVLFAEFRQEDDYQGEKAACKALGLEVPWPSWARQAKAAGWTPPENWKP